MLLNVTLRGAQPESVFTVKSIVVCADKWLVNNKIAIVNCGFLILSVGNISRKLVGFIGFWTGKSFCRLFLCNIRKSVCILKIYSLL